ncbi:MAG: FecCD family ABC transporter permease [Pyrinomonadaceae bacterium]
MKVSLKTLLISFFLLLLSVALGVSVGSEPINFHSISDLQKSILLEIRLPRVLLAATVGASLSISGAALQALLRNPLAEPYLLGVSNGAALGTLLAFVFLESIPFSRPVMAFTGAATATFIVYRIAKTAAGMTSERLVLSGVIVTTFLSSLIILLTSVLDAARLQGFTFWLLGDLSQATYWSVAITGVTLILAGFALIKQSRALNLMMIGERDALDLGVETALVRLTVFAAASALVGASVAAGGSVGYVGLTVPHLVRLAGGSDNRFVLPMSLFVGASFVVIADTVARVSIAPRELPVGAITALVGAPMFIYLLRK